MLILFVIVVLGFIEATILGGFDDYWNINDWNSLAKAFPYRDNRNKLLVTTRKINVDVHIDPQNSPYDL